ncbi:MAG TPA: hypothetical protein EYQ12_08525 [Oceanospirillaceae bacterium]|nr:hypothetical protein [Oceanospirillaceae bacterium]
MSTKAEAQHQQNQHYDDEIDLKDLIVPLWRAKFFILLMGSLVTMSLVVFYLGGFVLQSSHATLQLQFNFKGVETGKFPNGANFSPLELISTPVLAQVYQQLKKPSFSYSDLQAAVTLAPNFVGTESIEKVVISLIAKDKGLSVDDFNTAIDKYTQVLSSRSKTHVSLSLDLALVSGNFATAQSILTNIPAAWAQQALQDRGVLATSTQPLSRSLSTHLSEDLLVKINLLSDAHLLLSQQTEILKKAQFSSITDPETDRTMTDVAHLLSVEGKYKIAILKEMIIKSGAGVDSLDWYHNFRAARLGKLRRESNRLVRMVVVYEDALAQFSQAKDATQNPRTSMANSQSSEQIYAPQLSDGLINSLLELGSSMSDPAFRKQLIERKIDISSQLQSILSEIEFYQTPADDGSFSNLDTQRIEKSIAASNDMLFDLNRSLVNISSIVNQQYLGDNGQLYNLLGSVLQQDTSNMTSNIQLKLILGFILGCFIAVLAIFIRRVISSDLITATVKNKISA